MLSFRLINKICKPHMFRLAKTTPDIVVAGLSKIYIEQTLLSIECGAYLCAINLALFGEFTLDTIPNETIYINGVIFPLAIVTSYCYPLFRAYKSIGNNTLEIINLDKR